VSISISLLSNNSFLQLAQGIIHNLGILGVPDGANPYLNYWHTMQEPFGNPHIG